MKKNILSLRELALFGILGSLTFATKTAMAFLPNIEPTSLMIMLFAVAFGRKALYPIYIYVGLEFLFYGFHLWAICYLYIWLILAAAAWLCRNHTRPLDWAALSGSFGLLFGLFCTPIYGFVGGWGYALSWWINGIPFDILHGIGNFVIAGVLFMPLRRLLTRLCVRQHIPYISCAITKSTHIRI